MSSCVLRKFFASVVEHYRQGNLDFIGSEFFLYENGPIAGKSGGNGFDYDNNLLANSFVGHTCIEATWSGSANILAGNLRTENTNAFRPLNGSNIDDGAISTVVGASSMRSGAVVGASRMRSAIVRASRMRSGAVVGASSMRSAIVGASRMRSGAVVSTTAAGTADSLEPAFRSFSRLIFTEAPVLSGRA